MRCSHIRFRIEFNFNQGQIMTTLECLAQRLDTLERELYLRQRQVTRYRRWLCGMGTFAIAGIGLLGAQPAPSPNISEVVRAKRFEVIDDNGRLVLAASATPQGGQLDLWNDTGDNLLRAGCNRFGGDLAVWNTEGSNVFGAFATDQGGESALWNAAGVRVLRSHAAADGGTIDIHNAKDEPILSHTVNASGGAILVKNAVGQGVMVIDADQQGDGRFRLADHAGLVGLRAQSRPHGGLVEATNASGMVVGSLGAMESGHGQFAIANAQGARIAGISADAEGSSKFDLGNESGSAVFTVQSQKDIGATLSLLNASGKKTFAVGSTAQGPVLNLMNRAGNPVLIAGFAEDGRGGAMSMKNGRGITIFSAGTGENEKGSVSVWDADGKKMRSLTP